MTERWAERQSTVAIAISVDDRFDDVRLLVDLIRHNWDHDCFVVVCSSHPNPESHLKGCDVDVILVTEALAFDASCYSPSQVQTHLTLRRLDTMRKACQRCAQSDAPYTIHLHGDSLPLSEAGVFRLFAEMGAAGKVFAARGYGFGFYSHDCPLGEIDDRFLVFENAFARSAGLWNFDLADALPHKIAVHGWLPLLAMSRVGLSRVHIYARHDDAEIWDGRSLLTAPLDAAQTMYFDPRFKFLHLPEDAFPADMGARLKAHYLVAHGMTRGAAVRDFVERWRPNADRLFEELHDVDRRIATFFRRLGLAWRAETVYGRDFRRIEGLISGYRAAGWPRRVKWLAQEHLAQARARLRRCYDRPAGEAHTIVYRDGLGRRSLDDVYRRTLHSSVLQSREFADIRFDVAPDLDAKPPQSVPSPCA